MSRRSNRSALVRITLLACLSLPAMLIAQEGDQPPNLEGVWAQRVVTASVSSVPVVGEIESDTIAVLRVEMEQTGDRLIVSEDVCSIRIASDFKRVRTIIPDALVRARGIAKRPAIVRRNGKRWTYEQPRRIEVLGADVEPGEELPSDENDRRVEDSDRDGKPGVTVRIEGLIDGEIYVAQKSWNALEGEIGNDGKIRGRTRWNTEQIVLDASSMFLESDPDARPHPNPDRSYFHMTRIGPSLDCDAIVDRQAALFGSS